MDEKASAVILLPGWILLCTGLVLRTAALKKETARVGTMAALWGLGLLTLLGPLGGQGLFLLGVLSVLALWDE